MCPVRPFLRARGWLAGGEPHDRPREAGAGLRGPVPPARTHASCLGPSEASSPFCPHQSQLVGLTTHSPASGPPSLGTSEGGGALAFVCITRMSTWRETRRVSPWRQSWGWSLCEATGASRRGAERPGERPWAGSLPSLGLRPPRRLWDRWLSGGWPRDAAPLPAAGGLAEWPALSLFL